MSKPADGAFVETPLEVSSLLAIIAKYGFPISELGFIVPSNVEVNIVL